MATDQLTSSVSIGCPACGAVIPVPFVAELAWQGDRQYIEFTPDMTDLWAHAWTHGAEGNYGDMEKA